MVLLVLLGKLVLVKNRDEKVIEKVRGRAGKAAHIAAASNYKLN